MPRSYRNLKKGLIRPDWNKHTLFSLSRLGRDFSPFNKTFFQEKWQAKARLRGYHSPHVREKRWQRIFDRRLPAVVPMDYRYMARHDGSELSAGRGGGLIQENDGVFTEQQGQSGTRMRRRTPYMNMTFFPLEKRLDSAIFRALFASSLKQARSMVLHGAVKVNGVKMTHPGYLLNPGDLFQVEPEHVLYATGASKIGRRKVKEAAAEGEATEEDAVEDAEVKKTKVPEAEFERKALDIENASQSSAPRKSLIAMRQTVKNILDKGTKDLPGARLQELREFKREIVRAISKIPKSVDVDEEAHTAAKQIQDRLTELTATFPDKLLGPSTALLRKKTDRTVEQRDQAVDELINASVQEHLKYLENPHDKSKPYATPWKPRKYMSAFAFIPRYLEVNQNICAAVYLRHPVARPGVAEVPTPFDDQTNTLGFNWYLRRG